MKTISTIILYAMRYLRRVIILDSRRGSPVDKLLPGDAGLRRDHRVLLQVRRQPLVVLHILGGVRVSDRVVRLPEV